MDLGDWRPFSYTFVIYRHGDHLGWVSAGLALAPVFIVVAMVTMIVNRRDLGTAAMFAGQLGNEVVNYVLKSVIKAPRPSDLHEFSPKYGMPSNHAQFMGFFAVYTCLWALRNWRAAGTLRLALAAGTQALAVCVMVSRVYLLYHSWTQVGVGYAVGAGVAVCYYAVVEGLLRPTFPRIAAWRVCAWAGVRDLSPVDDVWRVEYLATLAAVPAAGGAGAGGGASGGSGVAGASAKTHVQ